MLWSEFRSLTKFTKSPSLTSVLNHDPLKRHLTDFRLESSLSRVRQISHTLFRETATTLCRPNFDAKGFSSSLTIWLVEPSSNNSHGRFASANFLSKTGEMSSKLLDGFDATVLARFTSGDVEPNVGVDVITLGRLSIEPFDAFGRSEVELFVRLVFEIFFSLQKRLAFRFSAISGVRSIISSVSLKLFGMSIEKLFSYFKKSLSFPLFVLWTFDWQQRPYSILQR